MKYLILTLHIVFFAALVQGQSLKTKTYEKDSGYVEIVYFPNGKISSITLRPKKMYSRIDGYAKAYNLQGKEIFRETISTLGGHGGVRFQYHPNGVIQSANTTFQPDGGIQRHDVTRYYDNKGNFTHESDNSLPFKPTMLEQPVTPETRPIPNPPPAPVPANPPVKQQEMRCAGIAHMKAFVENNTEVPVSVKMTPHNPKSKVETITVKPGERLYFAEYIMAEQFVDPTTYYRFELVGESAGKVKFSNWTMHKLGEGKAYYIMAVLPRL